MPHAIPQTHAVFYPHRNYLLIMMYRIALQKESRERCDWLISTRKDGALPSVGSGLLHDEIERIFVNIFKLRGSYIKDSFSENLIGSYDHIEFFLELSASCVWTFFPFLLFF